MSQTILGASGIIGIELAKELSRRGETLRLVSRKPPELHLGEERITADLLDADAVKRAVKGSKSVYLTAGLAYDVRIWKDQWPKIIRNAVDACFEEDARLVFFDNVYMYGPVEGWMTEETPLHPSSQKGKIREALHATLMEESRKGNLDIRIARSADFYGPGARNGIPNVLIFANLAQGKNPQWLVNGKRRHSLTYTLDAARATAELGLRDELPGRPKNMALAHRFQPSDSGGIRAGSGTSLELSPQTPSTFGTLDDSSRGIVPAPHPGIRGDALPV